MENGSVLQLYSLGIAASNKVRGSNQLDVVPTEKFTMVDGELTSAATTVSDTGTLDDGSQYTTSVNTTNIITATWLPRGTTNRYTPPDIRRGEKIALYRLADSDKFFWNQETSDLSLRKLETVTFLFSGTKDEAAQMNSNNYYCVEISTHEGHILIHTTTANNEAYSYDVVLDTKNGTFILTDSIKNLISLESKAKTITLKNADNTKVELVGKKINAEADDEITATTKTNATINAALNATVKATNISAQAAANISLSAGGGISMTSANGSGTAEISGNMKVNGNASFTGNVSFQSSVSVGGSLTVTGPITSASSIHGTNI